jgi:hypothetical protein
MIIKLLNILQLVSGIEHEIPKDGMFFYTDFLMAAYARHYVPVKVGSNEQEMKLYVTT